MKHRPVSAQTIAVVIAAGGTPYALGIIFAAFANPVIPLLFAPGWFAYLALIQTALGGRFRGDPFTTWLSCILVNGFWIWQLNPYFEFDPRDGLLHHYTTVYSWAAVILAAIGLIVELSPPLRIGESVRRFRKWLNS